MALKCETHTAYIYDRGGRKRLGQVDMLTSVSWERVRDDMSFGTVKTSAPTWECVQMLADIQPNRHELVIFRGDQRVWEGPISRVGFHSDYVEIEARDVMYYAYRTVKHAAYNNAYPNIGTVVNRALKVLTDELSRKEALSPPINVVPHIRAFRSANDAGTSKNTPAYEGTVFSEVDNLAMRSGLDYTVVGRSIILFDTHTVFAKTKTVTEADFLGDIVVTMYGMDAATRSYTTSGEGLVGMSGGLDPYYGEWEIIDSAYNEEGTEAPTQGALDSQAQRNLSGRNPVPLVVRIPDNSSLNPNGSLSITDLVPGVRIPLRATLTAKSIAQMQKLDKVSVKEEGSTGELIGVTLSPASKSDEDAEEEA